MTIKVGDTFNTAHGVCKVIEYVKSTKILVEFENTGGRVWCQAGNLRAGLVKDFMAKTVFGVGYIGGSEFKARKESGAFWPQYTTWAGMIRRCYAPSDNTTVRNYIDAEVAEEWHSYANFYKWCATRSDFRPEYKLDKDILVPGNKLYSPQTCCFVPSHINTAVTQEKHTNTSGYAGVGQTSREGYSASITLCSQRVYLGNFDNIEHAALLYKNVKETYIKTLAEVYKDSLTEETYAALINWRVKNE